MTEFTIEANGKFLYAGECLHTYQNILSIAIASPLFKDIKTSKRVVKIPKRLL